MTLIIAIIALKAAGMSYGHLIWIIPVWLMHLAYYDDLCKRK